MTLKYMIMIAGMVSLTYSKPIMVSFGTNKGPIVPAQPRSTTLNPLAPKQAAPVFEREENAPEPPKYRPPTPHQYRKELYSFRPNPNLVLGTPLDIKYTPALEKYDLYNRKSQVARSEGLGYTGPQAFDVQEYEIERAAKKAGTSSSKYFVDQYRTQKRQDQQPAQQQQQFHYQQQPQQQYNNNYQFNNQRSYVPGIGIVYSSGVRYYIPQLTQEGENSVYDRNDVKYYYRQQY